MKRANNQLGCHTAESYVIGTLEFYIKSQRSILLIKVSRENGKAWSCQVNIPRVVTSRKFT